MIEEREKRAYEAVETRFRKACLDDSSPYSDSVWRFMSKTDVRALISAVESDVSQEEDIAPSAVPSTVSIVRQLLDDDLLREVGEPTKEDFRIYWLTLRGGRTGRHNPFELISSLSREGVVSHFSALAFHDLTDLRPTAHFLTAPTKRSGKKATNADSRAVAPDTNRRENRKGETPSPKIGTWCFTHAGVEYRLRRSVPKRIFGEVEAWTDDYERISVFEFERALLDAVNDPACNGGIRGIVEAWEKGADRVRLNRLEDHLRNFNRSSLWRRVGTLADYVGRDDIAGMIRNAVQVDEWTADPLPLVWNRSMGSIAMPWNVIVPW